MKIAVGCGSRNYGKDFLHIDGALHPHVHHYDIVNLPCEDNSADYIYACHVFEYFDPVEGAYVLKRWFDKLKPNGVLRIAVPNFEEMSSLYSMGRCKLEDIIGPLYGRMKMNNDWIYHKSVWDFLSLERSLMNTGFNSVHKYDWRLTEHANIDDHSQSYLPKMDKENGALISLNIEAIK